LATYRNVPADIYGSARARIVTMVLATAQVSGQRMEKAEALKIAADILDQLGGSEITQFVRSIDCPTLTRVAHLISDYLDRDAFPPTAEKRERH